MMERGKKSLETKGKDASDGQPPAISPDAFDRMAQSILQKKIAIKICGHCGGQGHFRITQTRGPVRYLTCTACGIPKESQENCQVVVTRAEVLEAFGTSGPEVQLPQPPPVIASGLPPEVY